MLNAKGEVELLVVKCDRFDMTDCDTDRPILRQNTCRAVVFLDG
jgi:hypothetical protein